MIVSLPTDEAVLNDPDYQKREYKRGGHVTVVRVLHNPVTGFDEYLVQFGSGVHAEYVSVPWNSVYPVPDTVSTRVAAAALIHGATAVTFMEEAYNVQKGDIILIHTVAGGLGLTLCQLAKSRGAIVIGTTSTEEKAELAKQNGADHVIIYKKEDTVEKVLEITHGEGVHAVFDGVGKDTYVPSSGGYSYFPSLTLW